MQNVRNALQGVRGAAKVGSCKAQCERVAGLIFVKTGGSVRPDLYSVDAFHYHLRIPRAGTVIVDPTYYQFFQIPAGTDGAIFIGSRDALISELDRCIGSYGINAEVLTVASAGSGDEMYNRLWGPARLKISGASLYQHVGRRGARGFYS